jgi:hypothetical protein
MQKKILNLNSSKLSDPPPAINQSNKILNVILICSKQKIEPLSIQSLPFIYICAAQGV